MQETEERACTNWLPQSGIANNLAPERGNELQRRPGMQERKLGSRGCRLNLQVLYCQ
jgi:hypothetical protein